MVIDVENYLSNGEIREIIKQELAKAVQDDAERILNNATYHVIFKVVDEVLDNNAKDLIREKSIDIINNLSIYEVFRRRNEWEKEDSIAYQTLQETVKENINLIKTNVIEAIQKHNYETDIMNNSDYIIEGFLEIMRRGLSKWNI